MAQQDAWSVRGNATPGSGYEVEIEGINYECKKLTAGEEGVAKRDWLRAITFYTEEGAEFSFLDGRDYKYFLIMADIANKRLKGSFGGSEARGGQFGFRASRVNDLMGGTAAGRTAGGNDREWGANAATEIFGTTAWTVGRREWMADGSQSGDANEFVQDEETFENSAEIECKDTNDTPWEVIIFGVKSYNRQSVMKAVLAKIDGKDIADWDIEPQMRMGSGRVAKRGTPYFLTDDRPYKIGLFLEVTTPEQIAPLAFTFAPYKRLRQVTLTNCRVSS